MYITKFYISMKELEEYITKKLPTDSEGFRVVFRDIEKNYNDFSIEFLCEIIKGNNVEDMQWMTGIGRSKINLDELKRDNEENRRGRRADTSAYDEYKGNALSEKDIFRALLDAEYELYTEKIEGQIEDLKNQLKIYKEIIENRKRSQGIL